MKERLSAFFKNPRCGKKRRISLVLTIVALVEVLAIMVVSTSAWVESISSIKIFTTAQTTSGGTKGIIESALNQRVNLGTGNGFNNTYDLSQYFRPSGAFHFTSASSPDGKTMYFPEFKESELSDDNGIQVHDTTSYRIGGINDKNVNYIGFTISTASVVNLAFDAVPKFYFDGAELTGEDQKLVRFAIGDNSGNYKVYSLYPEEFTELVPADETVSYTDENTNTGYELTTVYPIADYVKGKNKVVTTVGTSNTPGHLSFSMWIQDPEGSNSSVYDNKRFTVSNDFKLVIVIPFTVYSTYKNGTSYTVDTSGVSGTVAIENSEYAKEVTYYAVPGQTINLHAQASSSNGYQFMGWNTTITDLSVLSNSTVDPYQYQVPNNATATSNNKLYAKFSNEHDIYLRTDFGGNYRYAAFVFGAGTDGTVSGAWYDFGNPITTSGHKWYNYRKCTYKGNATNIIFGYMDPNSTENNFTNCWLQTFDLVVPSRDNPDGYGYVVTCRSVINGESVNINGTNTLVSNPRNDTITQYGTNKLLGYWVHNHVKIAVDYTSDSPSDAQSATSKEKIFQAINDTSRTEGHAWWYNDDYTNKYMLIDGMAYQDKDSNGNLIANQKYTKAVTVNAEDSSRMLFKGWYTDPDGADAHKAPDSTVNGVTYHYDDHAYSFIAPDNDTYEGTDVEKTVTYYAKYEKIPAEYYLTASWNSWSISMNHLTGSGDEITVTQELDPGDYQFQVYEAIDGVRYYKDYGFKYKYNGNETYLDSVSGNALSVAPSNTNISLKVGYTANFTFHLKKSTMRFWITATDVTTYHVVGFGNDWDYTNGNKMNLVSGTHYSKTMYVSDGETFKIRINGNTYYGNGWVYHDNVNHGYSDQFFGNSNGGDPVTTSGTNMTIYGNGNYTFHFDAGTTKKFWITKD